jgi:hypothetical protein
MDYKDRPQLSGFAAPHTPALTELPHAQLNAVWLSGITSQTELQSRVQFDEMMFRLSKTFIDLPVDPIDSELNNGLKALADVLDLDRVSINLLDSDKKSRTITHSWAGPGIPLSIKPYLERFQRALDNQYYLVFLATPKKNAGLQRVNIQTEVSNSEIVAPNNVWVAAAK